MPVHMKVEVPEQVKELVEAEGPVHWLRLRYILRRPFRLRR